MQNRQVTKRDFLRIVKFLALVGGARGDQGIPTDQRGIPKFLVKKHLYWALGFFEKSTDWPDGLNIPEKYTIELINSSGAILKHMEQAFALPIIQFDEEAKQLAEKLPNTFSINDVDSSNDASKVKATGALYSKTSYPNVGEFEPSAEKLKDDESAKLYANALNLLLTQQVFEPTAGGSAESVVAPVPAPARQPAAVASSIPPASATPMVEAPRPVADASPAAPPQAARPGPQHDIKALRVALKNSVIDQPLAIREFLQEVQLRNMGLNPTDKPALFLLAGPPGCGKSLMAKTISQAMSAKKPVLLLNMAAMTSRNEGFGLTGLRRGYDSAAPGKLTDFIRKNPEGIVILDQFDRAHPNVQNLLIPLFTDGELTDEYGFKESFSKNSAYSATISFNKCWIFLISAKGDGAFESAGYETQYASDIANDTRHLADRILADLTRVAKSADEKQNDEVGQSALAAYLPACRVLPFHPVGLPGLLKIADNGVERFRASLSKSNIPTPWADELRDRLKWALVLGSGPDITPLDAELAVSRDLAAAFTSVALSTGLETVSQLNLKVDSSGEPSFEKWHQGEVAPETIKKDLFRRNQRLAYVVTPEFSESTQELTLLVKNFKLVSVPNVLDHGHDTGINLSIPDIRFGDIKGHDHIKARLTEVKDLLRKHEQFSAPKGMLLYGRPGTGKTMLARALAGEIDMPFIAVTGPQLLNIEIVRKVFKLARKYAPSILFIDEIDALGVRGKGGVDVVINQMLAEIDGFKSSSDGRVFVLAATNFREKVDPAITRSGRLDWVMEVPALDKGAREHFFHKTGPQHQKTSWKSCCI